MSDYSDESESYYDDLAEAFEGGAVGGGGGGKKIKKKTKPTTVGKQRLGGIQSWGTTEKACSKGCVKKCCSGAAKVTPALKA